MKPAILSETFRVPSHFVLTLNPETDHLRFFPNRYMLIFPCHSTIHVLKVEVLHISCICNLMFITHQQNTHYTVCSLYLYTSIYYTVCSLYLYTPTHYTVCSFYLYTSTHYKVCSLYLYTSAASYVTGLYNFTFVTRPGKVSLNCMDV